jgi:hypothetical protein
MMLAAQACSGLELAIPTDGGGADGATRDAGHESSAREGSTDAPADAPCEAAFDAPTDVAPDVEEAAAPWSPASLGSAMVLWLDGDQGVSTAACGPARCIQSWADQSSHGNDAFVAAGGTAPTLAQGVFHGHSGATFDGDAGGTASLGVADGPSIEFTGGFTILVVAVQNTTTSPHVGALFGKTNPGAPYAGPFLAVDYVVSTEAAGTQLDIDGPVVSSETNLDGVLRAYTAVYDGASQLSLRVDDDPPTVGTLTAPGPLTAPGTAAYIGGRPGSGQVVAGSIAEVIAMNAPITTSQWTSAWAYVQAKYALP